MQENNLNYRKRGKLESYLKQSDITDTDQNTQNTMMVRFGKIDLPVNPQAHPYVPQSQNVVGCTEILQAMSVGVIQKKPILLVGETGTGKTTLVHELAYKTNNALHQINLNGNTTVDEIVGRTMLNAGGTHFHEGILITAMREGHWILFDELNAGLPEVLLVLQHILTHGKYTLVENDGEIIEAHPNFRVFGTMNPPETYIGTNHLNMATLSRFQVTIEVNYPEPKLELEIVKTKLPEIPVTPENDIVEVIRLANDVRNGYAQQEYAYLLSTRDVISWLQVNEYYNDLVESAKFTILGKCGSDDKKALESILRVYFSGTVTLDVTPADGTYNMIYKKGNLMQVCDGSMQLYSTKNNDTIGTAVAGSLFEVLQVKNNVPIVRFLKGKIVRKMINGDEDVEVAHSELLRVSDLRTVSTRRIDGKQK